MDVHSYGQIYWKCDIKSRINEEAKKFCFLNNNINYTQTTHTHSSTHTAEIWALQTWLWGAWKMLWDLAILKWRKSYYIRTWKDAVTEKVCRCSRCVVDTFCSTSVFADDVLSCWNCWVELFLSNSQYGHKHMYIQYTCDNNNTKYNNIFIEKV